MCSTKIEKCLYLRTKRVPAISQNPIPIHRELSFHRPVPIQSYQHQSFSLIHISASRPGNSRGRWGRRRRHVSPRCRLGHPSVRVGGRHTLAAPACVCSPVASLPPHSPRQQPSPCTAPARAHPATLHPSPLVSHTPHRPPRIVRLGIKIRRGRGTRPAKIVSLLDLNLGGRAGDETKLLVLCAGMVQWVRSSKGSRNWVSFFEAV
jgi:hypothetical protein